MKERDVVSHPLVFVLGFAAFANWGCSDGGAMGDTSHGEHPGDSGQQQEPEFPDVPCQETHPGLMPGLSATAGNLTLKVVSAAPTRARQKTRNDWTLQLTDLSGAAVSDASFAEPVAYMSVHNHFGLPPPTVVQETDGRVKLDNIYFSMRGPWEVSVQVKRGADAAVKLAFNVCVE